VIAGHHGGLPWAEELQSLLVAGPTAGQAAAIGCLDRLGISIDPVDPREVVAPWAVPSSRADERGLQELELWLRMVFSALVDADHLDTEAHFRPERAALRDRGQAGVGELWARLQDARSVELGARSGDPVAAARARILDEVLAVAGREHGWFDLTAPTGSGKTITGLAFALAHARVNGLRGVVMAVPFVSVTEQVAGVYRSLLDRPGERVVVEHHSGLAAGDGDGWQTGEGLWARLATENWDSPVVVTTTVQLLESLFHNRTGKVRKLHRLAGSVIIVDEVQSIPWRLLEPTLEVLRSLVANYGCSVVFSSATPPPFDRIGDSSAAPPVSLVDPEWFASFQRVEATYLPGPLTHADLADLLATEAGAAGGAGLVVLNTIRDARQVAGHLAGVEGLLYLSTRLCPAHRRAVLREATRRFAAGEPSVVVSTQLIEAGIDIDVPVGIRVVGPIPSIAQVAGRVNRHGLRDSGRLLVVELDGGRVPPDEYRLGTSIASDLLRAGHDPLGLGTLELFYDRFLDTARGNLDLHGIQDARRYRNYPKVAELYRLIVDDTVGVLVAYGGFDPWSVEVPDDPGRRRGLARSLQPYTVSLRRREFDLAREAGTVQPVGGGWLWVWRGAYDDRFGLMVDQETEAVIW
jgi:CRISPR-associated endonuclease/helicase Cas3